MDQVRGQGAGRRKCAIRLKRMSILRRLITPPSGLRRGFETDFKKIHHGFLYSLDRLALIAGHDQRNDTVQGNRDQLFDNFYIIVKSGYTKSVSRYQI